MVLDNVFFINFIVAKQRSTLENNAFRFRPMLEARNCGDKSACIVPHLPGEGS
jgi:hypothetical protein